MGVGSYRIDLHPSTGGDNYIDVSSLPFQIPLGALIPKRMREPAAGLQEPRRHAHHQRLLPAASGGMEYRRVRRLPGRALHNHEAAPAPGTQRSKAAKGLSVEDSSPRHRNRLAQINPKIKVVFSRPVLKDRWYLLLCAAFLLVSLPARFSALDDSFWLDEAWVANAITDPSLHGVFFPKTWSQTMPPLFLLFSRWPVLVANPPEILFRILPTAAGIAGLVIAAFALRRWLSAPAALLAFTMLAGNYWVIKYSQQLKQYSGDFLVSALLLLLLGGGLERGFSRRRVAAIVAVGAVGLFASYTTVFWVPTLVLFTGLPVSSGGKPFSWRDFRWKTAARVAILLGALLVLVQVVSCRRIARRR